MVIRRTDRVADVLAQDESLVEAFVAVSDAFRTLRNPVMRRTMARLATVEHAARVAGLDPDDLVARLNAAAGGEPGAHNDPPRPSEETPMPDTREPVPPALARIPAERVVDLDVRDDLRNGHEPFSRIMAARREVPEGGALRLRAIFEPAPLYAVMGRQGFEHWTERLADDDWRVTFYRDAEPPTTPAGSGGGTPRTDDRRPGAEDEGEEDVVVIDVRGMEPPEPMVRTLAALEELPAGKTLVQINERVPQFLLPRLEELGFGYEVREQGDALVRVFIRRRGNA